MVQALQLSKANQAMAILEAYIKYRSYFQNILPVSVNVDVILILLGQKPCFRTICDQVENHKELLQAWSSEFNLSFLVFQKKFLYVGADPEKLSKVCELDQSYAPHEKELGAALGYPACCSQKIAEVGEDKIDEYEEFIASKPFSDKFKLINPIRYRQGQAFISHVPCCQTCVPSLNIATSLFDFVKSHPHIRELKHWMKVIDLEFSNDRD